MAFIIPNATDTASGAKYENLDQAEPDSLDFEILGNAGRSGVLSGCAVTALSASNTAVSVSGGVVILNGQPYIVSGQSSFALPAAPTDARFDVIVVRVSASTATLTTVKGNDELANPEFPQSNNALASGVTFDGSIHINLETDVVLASIYRQSTQNITESRIADRRVLHSSSIFDQGTAAPSSSSGSTGSVFFRNNRAQGSSGAGLYVKNSTGSWLELAQNNGPQVPTGSVVGWALTSSVPTGWLECDGSNVSRTTYAELFSVIGTTYGTGDGSTTFGLPNFNGKHLRGTTNTGLLGTNVGSDSVNVPVPQHSHNMGHDHGMQHYHSVDHDHNTSVGNQSANHSHSHPHVHNATTGNQSANHTHGITHNHTANTSNSGTHFHSGWTDRLAVGPNGNYDVVRSRYWTEQYASNNAGTDRITGTGNAANPSNDGNHSHSVVFNAQITHNSGAQSDGHTHNLTTSGGKNVNNTNSDDNTTGSESANHNHSVTVGITTNLSNAGAITANGGGRGTTDTNSDSTDNTGSANASITVIPDSSYMRWMIKATGTQAATAADGDDILAEAREEVVTVELAGSGTLPASSAGAAYYRVPWAATLTAVKANRNGTNTNGSVTIDVNEGGTSVLSTEITIDQNEATSLTAATPAVISDSAIANDALLTFDIDSANTSDEGPLTVTLYFTRED